MQQRIRLAILGGFLILCLAGCGSTGPTDSVKFDATDLKSSLESLHKMSAGMSETQKKSFSESATAVAIRMNQGTQNNTSAETFWKGMHGMTKAEIEAKAREIEAQENAAKPK